MTENSKVLERVALITGGNSGVGLSIASHLLSRTNSQQIFTIILACRNQKKGEQARLQLLSKYPNSDIRILEMDTSSVKSVLQAVETLDSIDRLDLLFCNAGAMPIGSLCISGIIRGIFTHPVEFFESSEALYQKRGLLSNDGLGLTFQTNVFGHYLLIHKLIPLLTRTILSDSSVNNPRVIWTGSSASQLDFSRADYQHIHGIKPYESSKYIIDQIAVPLDRKLSHYNIRCYITEPGNVCTGFLSGLEIPLFQYLVVVVFYFFRIIAGISRFTITSDCAAEASSFVAFAKEDELDPRFKYYSNVTRFGSPYVSCSPLITSVDTGAFLSSKLDALVEKFDC
ncbi:NAD(P)-binding protein [Coemansia reversa NRRL 1564]|uniref:NAD(P)-binding protein n=1 Tax=Coemansia reversa (strain ATCC 12441 / NRRL 1564) TaxID=763665 RepID=A0A2G5BFG4_COERN|nr:NAD(P)-binding protein [Coemansia reversa NRRL 1564]|eukprot:PIA17768.1 NAD(P)-binding protein [Coemansia reversa NRRL 1564]